MNTVWEPALNGFMLGLSTGPACFSACVPMLLSVSLSEGRSGSAGSNWRFLGKFIGGRFLAYLVFGLIMGVIGDRLGAFGVRVGSWATILVSLILISYGLGVRLPHWGLCRMAAGAHDYGRLPFVLGVLTGLNVCPPFLLAISYTLQRSISPVLGMIFFLSFFVATTLYVLPVGFVGYLPRRELLVRIGKTSAVAVGCYFCYQGVGTLMIG